MHTVRLLNQPLTQMYPVALETNQDAQPLIGRIQGSKFIGRSINHVTDLTWDFVTASCGSANWKDRTRRIQTAKAFDLDDPDSKILRAVAGHCQQQGFSNWLP